jgi:hypothetical protein
MRRCALIMLATALGLAACASGGVYYGGYGYYDDPFYDPWDYGFRYGVYDTHEDIDVDIDRPDRERPPDFDRPDRPRPPAGSLPDRPSRPPGGFDRPSRPVGGGGGRLGGGGRSFGGGGGRR